MALLRRARRRRFLVFLLIWDLLVDPRRLVEVGRYPASPPPGDESWLWNTLVLAAAPATATLLRRFRATVPDDLARP